MLDQPESELFTLETESEEALRKLALVKELQDQNLLDPRILNELNLSIDQLIQLLLKLNFQGKM